MREVVNKIGSRLDESTPGASNSAPVAVVIVTYNSSDVLPGLLDSLADGLSGIERFEVVVVDNRSQDRSADIAAAHPIAARVIRSERNGGYAAGINIASASISPDAHVLILNPDVRLLRGSVRFLADELERSGAGIAVPRNFTPEGGTDPTLRREPSLATAWAETLLGGRLAARLGLSEIITGSEVYDRGRSVAWASGCALLVSARARRLAPFWDESFFLYSEEVEYQRRVRGFGLPILYVPEARITHIGGECETKPALLALLTDNRIRYFRRYHGRFATMLFRTAVCVGSVVRGFRSASHRLAALTAAGIVRSPLASLNAPR